MTAGPDAASGAATAPFRQDPAAGRDAGPCRADRSRTTLILGMAGCLAFVVLGAVLLLPVPVIGIPALLFFGYGFFALLRAWQDPGPALAFDTDGLRLYASRPELPPIPWDGIRELRRISLRGNRFVLVIVDDPAPFMPPAGPVQRLLRRANAAFGSPLQISANGIRGNFDALVAELERRRAAAIEAQRRHV
ncbi:STM3941 family protein [Marinibaculum pumilum]|uniref:STM3941 family protein n=1 Tax=Marinibaculum pumilum TaxID=1766165 RepID=A0ABV7KVB9_9PROT